MKFRTSRKLNNLILSIIVAILTFLMHLSNFLKNIRVGRYESLFILFWKAIKIARLAQKTGSFGLAETQVFLCLKVLFKIEQKNIQLGLFKLEYKV